MAHIPGRRHRSELSSNWSSLALMSCLFAVALVGCSSDAALSNCVPGESVSCACPSGAMGAQVCMPDRTFAACACEQQQQDAGPPDAAPVDASTDASLPRHRLRVALNRSSILEIVPRGRFCDPLSANETCLDYSSDVSVDIRAHVSAGFGVADWSEPCSSYSGLSHCVITLAEQQEVDVSVNVAPGGVAAITSIGANASTYITCLDANPHGNPDATFVIGMRLLGGLVWGGDFFLSGGMGDFVVLRGFASSATPFYGSILRTRQGGFSRCTVLDSTLAVLASSFGGAPSLNSVDLGYGVILTDPDGLAPGYLAGFNFANSPSPWQRVFGTSVPRATAIFDEIASVGNDFVAAGTVSSATGPLSLGVGGAALPPGSFIARFGATGQHMWSRALATAATGTFSSRVEALDAGAGTLAVTAGVGGPGPVTISIGSQSHAIPASGARLIALVDAASGVPRWSRIVTAAAGEMLADTTAVGVAPSNEVYVGGHVWGHSLVVAGETIQTPHPHSCFVIRFNADGSTAWTRVFPDCEIADMDVLPDGRSIIVGSIGHQADFGHGGFGLLPGHIAGFAARLSADGLVQWARRIGNGDIQSAVTHVALGGSVAVIAGSFTGDIDVDVAHVSGDTQPRSYIATLGNVDAD